MSICYLSSMLSRVCTLLFLVHISLLSICDCVFSVSQELLLRQFSLILRATLYSNDSIHRQNWVTASYSQEIEN